jgi:hypothetical protein
MKYKVGDKVRIREDLITNKRYNGLSFIPSMEQYKGKVATITNIIFGDHYIIDLDDNDWCWADEMFEDIVSNSMTVKDLLNHTDVEKRGLIISIYCPNDCFESSIGHNKINRNSELYKRFIDAYGDMIVDEVSFDIRHDCMIVMSIKVNQGEKML